MKDHILSGVLRLSAFWLRQERIPFGKRFLWDRICAPYLHWRGLNLVTKTKAGFRVNARPCEFQEGRLLFFGCWEPNVTEWFRRILKPGDVVLDVGANIGYYSLLSSGIVGSSGHVVAVEPSPRNRQRLLDNLHLNQVNNVTVLPCAAWDVPGEATLRTGDDAGGATLRMVADAIREEPVELAPLDQIVPAELHTRVRLIKIDVEGAEYRALLGMRRILDAARDLHIICEVSPEKERELGGSADKVFALLKSYNMNAFKISNDYTPYAFFRLSNTPPMQLVEPPIDETYVMFYNDNPDKISGCEVVSSSCGDFEGLHGNRP